MGYTSNAFSHSCQDWNDISQEVARRMHDIHGGRQRPSIWTRGDFNKVREADGIIPPCIMDFFLHVVGSLGGCLVVLIFLIFVDKLDIKCSVWLGPRGSQCPAQSCFCTDCDPCNMFGYRKLDWSRFGCRLGGIPLNRCRIALGINMSWFALNAFLAWKARTIWRQCAYSQRVRLTTLRILVLLVCSINMIKAFTLSWPPFIASLLYLFMDTFMLSSSVLVFLTILALYGAATQTYAGTAFILHKSIGRSFMLMAFVGEPSVAFYHWCAGKSGESIDQSLKFYGLYVYLGTVFAGCSWYMSRSLQRGGVHNRYKEIHSVMFRFLLLKIIWSVSLAGHHVLACSTVHDFAAQINLFAVIVQRLCSWATLLCLQKFADAYCNLQLQLGS
ncbi:unnamed protein product [Symbiodinium sp. CCMP2456]|nr:unnamed protein product [Symbiodinium sp. CCMP2456]